MRVVNCHMIATPIYASRREGWLSLIWGIGFGLFWTFVYGDVPRTTWWQFVIWFFAWWGVSLPFAISGLRRGDVRNRIYAGISVANFVFVLYMILRSGPGG